VPRVVQACSDPHLKAQLLVSKTFLRNTKAKPLLSAFSSLSFRMHLLSVLLCLNEFSWVSSVWAVVSSVTALSDMGMRRISETTAPGSAHCSEHRCFILSFSETYRWAAWFLGTVTTPSLVDRAGTCSQQEEKIPSRAVLTNAAVALQQYERDDYVLRAGWVSSQPFSCSCGETLGERKESHAGRGRPAALPGSHLCLCSGSSGCQPRPLGLQLAPGRAAESLTAAHFSILLQVGLMGSTYWDSRRQPKTIIQFDAEVKTCPHQQKRTTFPLNHHLDLCLWQATFFS